MKMNAGHLLREVRKTVPTALNASVGTLNDRRTWRVELPSDARDDERRKAQEILDRFDMSADVPDYAAENRAKINELVDVANRQPGVKIDKLEPI